MTLLTRYREDQTAPTILAVGRDLIVRALLPALALVSVGLGVGSVLVGPIGSSPAEDQLSVLAQSARTPVLDTVTASSGNPAPWTLSQGDPSAAPYGASLPTFAFGATPSVTFSSITTPNLSV